MFENVIFLFFKNKKSPIPAGIPIPGLGQGSRSKIIPVRGSGWVQGPDPEVTRWPSLNLLSSSLICWKSKIIENGSEAYTNMCRIVSNSIKQKFGLLLPLLISVFDWCFWDSWVFQYEVSDVVAWPWSINVDFGSTQVVIMAHKMQNLIFFSSFSVSRINKERICAYIRVLLFVLGNNTNLVSLCQMTNFLLFKWQKIIVYKRNV